MIVVHPSQVDPDDTGTECPGAGLVYTWTVEGRAKALRAARGERSPLDMVEALGLPKQTRYPWSRTYWGDLESGHIPCLARARLIERETGIPLPLLRLS